LVWNRLLPTLSSNVSRRFPRVCARNSIFIVENEERDSLNSYCSAPFQCPILRLHKHRM
jgi:hypothetical protein